MTNDATINLEPADPKPLVTVSTGPDGDAFVVSEDYNQQTELRVLSRASADNVNEIEQQLTLISLASHPGIRPVLSQNFQSPTPEFKLPLADGVDPQYDRLSSRLKTMSALEIFQVAAQIVETLIAAHRVGLFHGNLDPSTILLTQRSGHCVPLIDFSSMRCSPEICEPVRSLDGDQTHLLTLLQWMLSGKEAPTEDTELERLSGRQRAILRRWLRQSDPDAPPPSTGQWRSVLDVFLVQTDQASDTDLDQTGIVASPQIPAGSGSTSRIGASKSVEEETPMPKKLGRFRIESKIGEGGMGTVYRGTDPSTDQPVAIKVLRRTGKKHRALNSSLSQRSASFG